MDGLFSNIDDSVTTGPVAMPWGTDREKRGMRCAYVCVCRGGGGAYLRDLMGAHFHLQSSGRMAVGFRYCSRAQEGIHSGEIPHHQNFAMSWHLQCIRDQRPVQPFQHSDCGAHALHVPKLTLRCIETIHSQPTQ